MTTTAEKKGDGPSAGEAANQNTHTPNPHREDRVDAVDFSSERGVYARGAHLYRAVGWRGVLPLPEKAKYPPVVGFTGHDGAWPSDEQTDKWSADKADGNLALRVEHGFMGIDTDAYPPKKGGKTLAEAVTRWGPLPPTYRSTARTEDEISGIRVFRVPMGTYLKGVIKFAELDIGDIEIIQPHHRFIVAWPSINPKTGQTYRWFASDGTLMPEGQVPRVEDIPELPDKWVDELSRDSIRDEVFDGSAPNRSTAAREQVNEDLYQKLIAQADKRAPDKVVGARLDKAIMDLSGGSRYDNTRDHVLALMRLQALGWAGVPKALGKLFSAYVMEVGDARPRLVAESEFLRFTEGAALLVASSMPQEATGDTPPAYGSISGVEVLDKVEAWYRRFIRVTFDRDYQLLTLWAVHSHLAEECYTSPRLQLDSLIEGAGKTTVLDHFRRLCHNPIQIASLSSPALLPRLLNTGMHTILLDEVHRTLRPENPGVGELMAIINTGYRVGATRPVNVPAQGGGWDVEDMPTFAPIAMAGNNPHLENDTRSRMIRVLLMPDLDGTAEDSDWEYLEDDALSLQEEIAQWADSARDTVRGMRVELPAGCVGRSKEKWRPLKRIAVAAGGRWKEIADELIKNGLEEEEAVRAAGLKKHPPGMVLMTDLYAVWPKGTNFMPTQDLVDLLVKHNPSYWDEQSPYGKRLTETRLGLLIKQATNMTSVRPDSHGPRGYTLPIVQFAWNRLGIVLPPPPNNPENPAHPENPEQQTSENTFVGKNSYHPADCSESAESAECSGLFETPIPHMNADEEPDPETANATIADRFDALRKRLLPNEETTDGRASGGRHAVLDFVNGRAETTSHAVFEAGLAETLHQASEKLNHLCRTDQIRKIRRGVFGPLTPERNQS